jgi:hypothetical protein
MPVPTTTKHGARSRFKSTMAIENAVATPEKGEQETIKRRTRRRKFRHLVGNLKISSIAWAKKIERRPVS